MLPNYIYIGPDKSGSTWLFELLRSHPECYAPPCKDLYYFDKYYNRGDAWYSKHFQETNAKVRFDISHDYLFSTIAAQRIQDDLKNVQLVTFLRNPVERSISQYQYMRKMGLVPDSFMEAIKTNPEIITNSLYAQHLKNYHYFQNNDSLNIFFFDELQQNPEAFAERLSKTLGIKNFSNDNIKNKVRQASESRNILITKTLKKLALWMRAAGLENILGKLKSSRLIESLLFRNPTEKTDICTPEEKSELYQKYFAEDVAELEKITGKDLSNWKYQ